MAEFLVLGGLMIGVILAVFVAKKLIKLLIGGVLVLLLVFGVFAYFAYQDGRELVETFESGEITYLLVESGEVHLAVSVSNMSEVDYLEVDESYFLMDEYDSIIGDDDLLVIMDIDDYGSLLGEEVSVDDVVLRKGEVLSLMRSGAPLGEIEELSGLVDEESFNGDELKGYVFFSSLEGEISESDLLNLYKEGEVIVYPEGVALKVLKLLP
tara:strand:+ start:2805 stop:3437 length:633 start_codon:yes stop_codon:yes gene_type:complete